MQITNTTSRFGVIAILLHWFMAILILALLIIGLYMVRLPISFNKLKLYGWHKEYGMLALISVVLRLGWRFSNITPLLNELPRWEQIAARSVHWGFYFFMFAMPITGWLITSAAGLPVSFFGLFLFPNLMASNLAQMKWFAEIHAWLGYGLIAMIGLHSAAALWHHFINKDDILRRML